MGVSTQNPKSGIWPPEGRTWDFLQARIIMLFSTLGLGRGRIGRNTYTRTKCMTLCALTEDIKKPHQTFRDVNETFRSIAVWGKKKTTDNARYLAKNGKETHAAGQNDEPANSKGPFPPLQVSVKRNTRHDR